jgi:hypothetical protein
MLPPNVAKAMEPIMTRLANASPPRRIMLAHELYQQLLGVQADVAAARRSAVREMREQGQTFSAIAQQVGLTTGRIKQIEVGFGRADRKPAMPPDPAA